MRPDLCPVVQSIVSVTSSLRVISLTALADSIYNILIFFAEKNVSSFCTAKATHIFFSKTIQHICILLDVNFNESLTNDVVSFEQLGPGLFYLWSNIMCTARECPVRPFMLSSFFSVRMLKYLDIITTLSIWEREASAV